MGSRLRGTRAIEKLAKELGVGKEPLPGAKAKLESSTSLSSKALQPKGKGKLQADKATDPLAPQEHGVGIKYPGNIVNKERLNNQLRAEQITKGHAFDKHILHKGEFPKWIRTEKQMQNYLENIFNDPKIEKVKKGNSIAYIDRKHGAIIYRNTIDKDGATVFQPDDFKDYLKRELHIE